MRLRLHSKLIAALLAPVLIASGAAQGMMLVRCGPAVRISCCCLTGEVPSSPTIASAKAQCCDTLAIPSVPTTVATDRVVTTPPLPILVAALEEGTTLVHILERLRHVPRLVPSLGRSPILANCALLI